MNISSRSFWSAVDAAAADGLSGCAVAPDVGTTCEVAVGEVPRNEDDDEPFDGDVGRNVVLITPGKYCGPPDIESFEPTEGVSSVLVLLISAAMSRD